MVIPKIAHFLKYSKFNEDVPIECLHREYKESIEMFREFNENFYVKLWTNSKIEELLKLPKFEKYKGFWIRLNSRFKESFAKYLILYEYGGIYIDKNLKSFSNLENILDLVKIGLFHQPEHTKSFKKESIFKFTNIDTCFHTDVLISEPYHHFWIDVMDSIMENPDKFYTEEAEILTEIAELYLKNGKFISIFFSLREFFIHRDEFIVSHSFKNPIETKFSTNFIIVIIFLIVLIIVGMLIIGFKLSFKRSEKNSMKNKINLVK